MTMINNYLKVTYRNLKKNKAYSFIVISGFSIGLACFFLISMWIHNERSFDKGISNGNLIYKVDADAHFNNKYRKLGTQTNYTGPMLKKDLPEIVEYLRLYQPYKKSVVYSQKDKIYRESNVILGDQTFFEFFELPLTQGDPSSAVSDPLSVVISRNMSAKYFKNENPMGKTLSINGNSYKVTGVVDIESIRSHLNFDFLLLMKPFAFKPEEFRNLNLAYLTYVMVPAAADISFLEEKMTGLVNQYIAPVAKAVGMTNYDYKIVMRPLSDVYLHSNFSHLTAFRSGSPMNIYIMLAVAFIILFIVSFNYINLTLARSLTRTKEMGLRKVLGAGKSLLRRQMLGETAIQTGIAFVVSLLIAGILTPWFSGFSSRRLDFFHDGISILPFLILVVVSVIFLSGIFPATYLSRISPIQLVRNRFFREHQKMFTVRSWCRFSLCCPFC